MLQAPAPTLQRRHSLPGRPPPSVDDVEEVVSSPSSSSPSEEELTARRGAAHRPQHEVTVDGRLSALASSRNLNLRPIQAAAGADESAAKSAPTSGKSSTLQTPGSGGLEEIVSPMSARRAPRGWKPPPEPLVARGPSPPPVYVPMRVEYLHFSDHFHELDAEAEEERRRRKKEREQQRETMHEAVKTSQFVVRDESDDEDFEDEEQGVPLLKTEDVLKTKWMFELDGSEEFPFDEPEVPQQGQALQMPVKFFEFPEQAPRLHRNTIRVPNVRREEVEKPPSPEPEREYPSSLRQLLNEWQVPIPRRPREMCMHTVRRPTVLESVERPVPLQFHEREVEAARGNLSVSDIYEPAVEQADKDVFEVHKRLHEAYDAICRDNTMLTEQLRRRWRGQRQEDVHDDLARAHMLAREASSFAEQQQQEDGGMNRLVRKAEKRLQSWEEHLDQVDVEEPMHVPVEDDLDRIARDLAEAMLETDKDERRPRRRKKQGKQMQEDHSVRDLTDLMTLEADANRLRKTRRRRRDPTRFEHVEEAPTPRTADPFGEVDRAIERSRRGRNVGRRMRYSLRGTQIDGLWE